MVVTTAPFTATDLVAYLPKIWTPVVLEQYFNARVAARFCRDMTPFLQEGGNVFDIPDVFTNAFTIQTQSTQGAEVTTNDPVSVEVTLNINTHKYIAYLIGDKDMKQLARIYDFNAIYSRKAGRALADALDTAILALWSSITTNTTGTTSAAVTDLQIRQSMRKLDATFYPLDELAWFFHPNIFWDQVIAIQKYYDVGQLGRPPATMQSAVLAGGIGNVGSGAGVEGNKGVLYGFNEENRTKILSQQHGTSLLIKVYRSILEVWTRTIRGKTLSELLILQA